MGKSNKDNGIQNNNLTLRGDSIPEHLKRLNQWVCWKKVIINGRSTKMPIDANTMKVASTNNPNTFSSYQTAHSCYKRNAKSLNGLGIVLTKENDLIGIDLDKCLDLNSGNIELWAKEIIDIVDSYTEVSPSGTGIRIFCHGNIEMYGSRKEGIEIYTSKQYLTVTGDHIKGTPFTINERSKELNILNEKYFNKKIDRSKDMIIKNGHIATKTKEVINKINMSKYSLEFSELMNGKYKQSSQSEADLRLCGIISIFTDNAEQIDSIFRSSALYRDKWDEARFPSTYGENTINLALFDKKKKMN